MNAASPLLRPPAAVIHSPAEPLTWRHDPPTELGGLAVSEVVDLAAGLGDLPPTNALVVRLGGYGRVVLRPSGTEPKLKAYLEVTTEPPGLEGLAAARRQADHALDALRADVAERCRIA
jgi:phosphomannomutase